MIKLSKIGNQVPIALLVGKQDTLADEDDVNWLQKQLGDKVVFRKDYNDFDHFSFQVGKDMSYTQDVVDLLKKYAPNSVDEVGDESTTLGGLY